MGYSRAIRTDYDRAAGSARAGKCPPSRSATTDACLCRASCLARSGIRPALPATRMVALNRHKFRPWSVQLSTPKRWHRTHSERHIRCPARARSSLQPFEGRGLREPLHAPRREAGLGVPVRAVVRDTKAPARQMTAREHDEPITGTTPCQHPQHRPLRVVSMQGPGSCRSRVIGPTCPYVPCQSLTWGPRTRSPAAGWTWARGCCPRTPRSPPPPP